MGKNINVFIKVDVLAEGKWVSTVTSMVSVFTSLTSSQLIMMRLFST